jgi:hypothetical protein
MWTTEIQFQAQFKIQPLAALCYRSTLTLDWIWAGKGLLESPQADPDSITHPFADLQTLKM